MSITNTGFTVPRIFAESKLHSFTESANLPFVISGVDMNSSIKGEFVVKLKSSQRMSPSAALRETLASLLAIELGIPTPNPVIIEISAPFVATRRGFDDFQRFNESIGVNFGNQFLEDNVIQFVPKDADSFKGRIKELQEIFVFDLFIENADRTYNKPNLLLKNGCVYVIDHEIAFSFYFILKFLRNPKPWTIDAITHNSLKDHCLYANLKGKNFLAHDFFKNFAKLNDTFWTTAFNLLPEEWKLDDFNEIRDYLCLKVEHIDELHYEIMEVLK
ncbi:MAG: HipA family kinase [Melioribacteraceae bacterium]